MEGVTVVNEEQTLQLPKADKKFCKFVSKKCGVITHKKCLHSLSQDKLTFSSFKVFPVGIIWVKNIIGQESS